MCHGGRPEAGHGHGPGPIQKRSLIKCKAETPSPRATLGYTYTHIVHIVENF